MIRDEQFTSAIRHLMGLALGPHLPPLRQLTCNNTNSCCEVSCNLQMHMVHVHAAAMATTGPNKFECCSANSVLKPSHFIF